MIVYALFDLYGPRTSKLRSFDPNEVARLETAMWKSYYNRERFKLYREMTELLRTQYNLPFIRSNAPPSPDIIVSAARCAVPFELSRSFVIWPPSTVSTSRSPPFPGCGSGR